MSKPETRWQTAKDFAVYLVVRLVVCAIQATPIETCAQIAKWFGKFAARKIRGRAKVIDENLSLSFPQWNRAKREEVAAQMWEHLLLMICEIAHAPRKIHQTNWRKYVSVHNDRDMVRALTDPRPQVLVTGHFGNFEIGGYVAGLLGFPTYTMARDLDNPFLNDYLNRFREAKGQYTLPKKGSAALVSKVMEQKGTMCLVGDQYGGVSGTWVEFMGREASCHKGLALFTLTGGAPMVITYSKRVDQPMRFEVGVNGIADPESLSEDQQGVRQLTQWYNDRLREVILEAPDQYWWLHRRWREREKRTSRRQRRELASAKRAA